MDHGVQGDGGDGKRIIEFKGELQGGRSRGQLVETTLGDIYSYSRSLDCSRHEKSTQTLKSHEVNTLLGTYYWESLDQIENPSLSTQHLLLGINKSYAAKAL